MTLASLRWTEQFFSPHSNIEKKEGIVYKVFSQSENYVFLNLTMKNYVSMWLKFLFCVWNEASIY